MYVMTEVGTTRVPQLIEEVPFFFGELASITRVMSAFKYVVNCGQHTYEHDPQT
ncbi:hypothetical protein BCR43DRAFT_489042 [Syncephalastrum racemosum]|uniref:Uncharacterized protein n=1 Tax=Syncephalastrum racemosum TaxID=13706 RepID=A0A1X2HJP1_SYNRA|nr:hypothetical protein BCR43DRAFT_489042 [Syncephalastrum racemosum]